MKRLKSIVFIICVLSFGFLVNCGDDDTKDPEAPTTTAAPEETTTTAAPEETTTEAPTECEGLDCLNGGVFDDIGCSCDCPEGFFGELCDEIDIPELIGAGLPIDSLYGKRHQGGIIFFINQDGGVGKVALPDTESPGAEWGCFGDLVNANLDGGTDLDFVINTESIVAACDEPNIAARLCWDLESNGFDDWYLPAFVDLVSIYENLHTRGIGGFTDTDYWSSTEVDSTSAYRVDFKDGRGYKNDKNGKFKVRAIRWFEFF